MDAGGWTRVGPTAWQSDRLYGKTTRSRMLHVLDLWPFPRKKVGLCGYVLKKGVVVYDENQRLESGLKICPRCEKEVER